MKKVSFLKSNKTESRNEITSSIFQTIKKSILLLFILIGFTGLTNAQKFAYVDSDYILKNIPDYNAAQKQLDQLSVEWQKEIEAKYKEIDQLYKAFQAESVVLPDDVKQKRENEIIQKEKEVKELQKKRFGADGDLFKKRQELVKPIQDKVYNAIKELANTEHLDFIFDKSSSDATILFANPKLDKSDDVLKSMGYTPKPITNTNTKPTSNPNTNPNNNPNQNNDQNTNPNNNPNPNSNPSNNPVHNKFNKTN